MRYGIEIVKNINGNEYFGYRENVDTGKRTYLCHAYTAERCNQRLEERIVSDNA